MLAYSALPFTLRTPAVTEVIEYSSLLQVYPTSWRIFKLFLLSVHWCFIYLCEGVVSPRTELTDSS